MSWDIFGHDQVVNILRNHILQDEVRHAYLFVGIPGTGRRTIALQFAQALNCSEPPAPGEFCGKCRNCRQIAAQQHPDLIVTETETAGTILKIDEIRDLQHTLSLAPYESRWRIGLLLRFDEANQNAQNALLKILEEPPENVKLLLTADSENSLLPTITSRCEVMHLFPANLALLASYLTDRYQVESKAAESAAHLSAGRVGFAISLLKEPEKAEQMNRTAAECLEMFSQNTRERFRYASNFKDFKKRTELREVLHVWQSVMRDLLLLSTGGKLTAQSLTFIDLCSESASVAAKYSTEQFRELIRHLNRSLEYLDANVSPQLLLEELLLNFPS